MTAAVQPEAGGQTCLILESDLKVHLASHMPSSLISIIKTGVLLTSIFITSFIYLIFSAKTSNVRLLSQLLNYTLSLSLDSKQIRIPWQIKS
jgi:hypothetical protein